ncbi:MAG: PLP-dependent transferase [Oscillospiraceae bacterium]|nr:PLP-dependent transferase [Oscillospiraceae bacterium]
MEWESALLHGRFDATDSTGATLPAIYQNAAFEQRSAEDLERIFTNRKPGFAYSRSGNPTVAAFEQRMAAAEGGAAAVACASGMAAIAMALLNILQCGDEMISAAGLFGGTQDLFEDLRAFGIRTRFVPRLTPEAVEGLLSEKTKLVFGELISNPALELIDLAAVARVTRRQGIPLIIDSTTATPALVRPLALGADIVIHSATKYISGQGNAIGGVIVDGGNFPWDTDRFPPLKKYEHAGALVYTTRLRQDLWRNFGACMAPQNAYLSVLGLETLTLRVQRQCASALALARALAQNPQIARVDYPGLEGGDFYDLTQRQLKNGMGGAILTLRTGSKERAYRLLNHLRLAHIATNVGDVRTLVICPAHTIYAFSTQEQRRGAGAFPDLIRVSVGLEDAEDLIADFSAAAAAMGAD